ncbi:hypothetical protein STPH2_5294 [Streptomyces sp. KO7888]|uniref:hypothetical protein n=1 Tax=Streptomyces sp. KO7888 TaxID=2602737 RepID=UPI0013F5D726|nr:hypothetical protein [Streptomyces sp. KO7888]NHI09927.1 hypothetical protein [Streptomyces sp. KO7888]
MSDVTGTTGTTGTTGKTGRTAADRGTPAGPAPDTAADSVPDSGSVLDSDSGAAPGTRAGGDAATAAVARTAAGATPASAPSLLPPGASERLGERLHHAVAGFVDAPRASVEEADRVLEEVAAAFTDAVAHRRQTLRTSWHESREGGDATSTDTEQLRLALRDYRELADRLMRL